MKLFYSPGACSLSPHIVLRESQLPFELVRVQLRSPEIARLHPKGYVPLLQLDDGQILSEGPVIVQYIADLVPERGLAPPGGTMARYRLQEWLNFISTELHKTFSPLFNPATPAEFHPLAHQKLQKAFGLVEAALSEHPYLMGESFTVADAYLFAVSNWAAPKKVDLSGFPHLAAWRARMNERPAVQQALLAEKSTPSA